MKKLPLFAATFMLGLACLAQPMQNNKPAVKPGTIKQEIKVPSGKNLPSTQKAKNTKEAKEFNAKDVSVANSDRLKRIIYSLPRKSFSLPGGKKSHLQLINAVEVNSANKQYGQSTKPRGGSNNCETIEVSVSAQSENFDVPYENASSYIYPGAVYLYSDYYSNNVSPRTLTWARNPIYIQAASSSAGGENVFVEDPTSVNLNEAVGKIKKQLNPSPTNLNTSIKMVSVYDEADFRFKVNAGGGGMGFSAEANFGISNNSYKQYFMIDYKQLLYTLSAILPENDSSTVFKDIANNQNREALLMSTVSYGRRVLGVVETEFESKEMAVGFKARYSAGFAGGHVGLDMLDGMKREKTNVKLFFVGGQANAITIPNPTSQSVLSAINNYLKSMTTQNAVPISFTFRNMDMDPMRYESATDKFTYEQCTPVLPDKKYAIKLTLQSITNATDGGENINLGIYQDAILYINGQERRFDGQGEKTTNLFGLLKTPMIIPQPLLFWAEEDDGEVESKLPYGRMENAASFKGSLQIDRSCSTTQLQGDMVNENSYIEVNTRNITMYGFTDNHDFYDKGEYKRRIYLKSLLDGKEELKVNINHSQGRRFELLFLVTATPIN